MLLTERVFPKRIEAIEGSTVQLKCYSFQPASWFRYGEMGDNNAQFVEYTRSNYSNLFILEIKEVTFDNAGKYVCCGKTNTKKQFNEEVKIVVISKLVPIQKH